MPLTFHSQSFSCQTQDEPREEEVNTIIQYGLTGSVTIMIIFVTDLHLFLVLSLMIILRRLQHLPCQVHASTASSTLHISYSYPHSQPIHSGSIFGYATRLGGTTGGGEWHIHAWAQPSDFGFVLSQGERHRVQVSLGLDIWPSTYFSFRFGSSLFIHFLF